MLINLEIVLDIVFARLQILTTSLRQRNEAQFRFSDFTLRGKQAANRVTACVWMSCDIPTHQSTRTHRHSPAQGAAPLYCRWITSWFHGVVEGKGWACALTIEFLPWSRWWNSCCSSPRVQTICSRASGCSTLFDTHIVCVFNLWGKIWKLNVLYLINSNGHKCVCFSCIYKHKHLFSKVQLTLVSRRKLLNKPLSLRRTITSKGCNTPSQVQVKPSSCKRDKNKLKTGRLQSDCCKSVNLGV